ncbi:MAG: hypothetical protein ACRDUY_10610 [Nitriliruptorales bacterium]
MVKAHGWTFEGRIAAFGATVSRHTGTPWPGVDGEEAYDFELSAKSRPPSLEQPALLQLRLRAMLGVSARAEIVRVFLTNQTREWSAAEIAERVAYTKRQVTADLEMLTLSGVIDRVSGPGGAAYLLADPARVTGLVGSPPDVAPRWAPLFRSMSGLINAVEAASAPDLTTPAAELARHIRELEPALQRARLRLPPGEPDGDYMEETLRWVEALFSRLADGDAKYLPPDAMVRPSNEAVLARVVERKERSGSTLSAEQILRHRDEGRT